MTPRWILPSNNKKDIFLKHSLYIAFTFLWVFGCLFVADTPVAIDLMAQDSTTTEETAKQDEEAEKPKERAPVYLEKLTIILEGEEVLKQEGVHEWAGKAAKVITDYYPYFDKLLETEGFVPGKEMSVVFRKMDGVAFASGAQITISADWIRRSPGDLGMVAHELVHIIQRYPGGREGQGLPAWLMEGLTDYIRHVHFEPEVPMRPVNPNTARPTDSYQITGGFLMYIVDIHDKDFIKKLNEMGRKRTYSEDIFEKSTGKKLDDIWAEYVEKVVRPLHSRNQRIVPANQFPNVMKYKKEFEEHLATLKSQPAKPQPQQSPQQSRRRNFRQRAQ